MTCKCVILKNGLFVESREIDSLEGIWKLLEQDYSVVIKPPTALATGEIGDATIRQRRKVLARIARSGR